MHKCFKYTSVVSLVFVSLLQACGGGGSGGGGTVPTSAAQSSGVTNGVVSGFGSVLVDGNEIEDAKASVVAENADGTFSNTVLQLGQRVRVDHDGKATASKVTVDATLIGTISLVNAADQTIKIAGQVAGVNSDLSKGALTVWAGGYNSFSDLAVNDTAQIEGYMSGDSLIAKVVNTTGAGLDDDKFQKQSPNNSSAWNDYKQGKQQAKWGTGEPLSMSFNEVPSADYESGRLLNTPTPDFRVTGLYAPPGATLTVKVEGTRAASSNLKLLVGTYSR